MNDITKADKIYATDTLQILQIESTYVLEHV